MWDSLQYNRKWECSIKELFTSAGGETSANKMKDVYLLSQWMESLWGLRCFPLKVQLQRHASSPHVYWCPWVASLHAWSLRKCVLIKSSGWFSVERPGKERQEWNERGGVVPSKASARPTNRLNSPGSNEPDPSPTHSLPGMVPFQITNLCAGLTHV